MLIHCRALKGQCKYNRYNVKARRCGKSLVKIHFSFNCYETKLVVPALESRNRFGISHFRIKFVPDFRVNVSKTAGMGSWNEQGRSKFCLDVGLRLGLLGRQGLLQYVLHIGCGLVVQGFINQQTLLVGCILCESPPLQVSKHVHWKRCQFHVGLHVESSWLINTRVKCWHSGIIDHDWLELSVHRRKPGSQHMVSARSLKMVFKLLGFRDPGKPARAEHFLTLASLMINELSILGYSYFAPNHCAQKRQHDWMTASQHPLRFQECGSAFQNLMNIDILSNALVNTRQELWLAESVILPPREKCSAQAGLPILALPGPNSTTVLGPGKRACKIASGSLWPGFAIANQLSVWNASPQLLIHDHHAFSSSVILKGRVQNSRSWRSQVKSTNQITRNQGNTCHTRGCHNQASRIFNMIGWW